jgi:hypothetical protein
MASIQQELRHRSADITSPTRYQNLHAFTSPSCTLRAEPLKGHTIKQRKTIAAIHIVGFIGDADGIQ